MQGEQLADELQEARRQLAERDRQIEELRAQLEAQRLAHQGELEVEPHNPQNQLAEHDRQPQEGQADGLRRRNGVPGRVAFEQNLQPVVNFVANELGNGGAPRPRPDDREWRMQRAKTIETLNELREKLDTVCVRANCGKVVGTGSEILGSGGALVGAILTLSGSPVGPTYVNAGNLLCNAGSLINGASNVAESIFSAKYLNDIEKVLKRDQELSRPLEEWLNFSNELDANVKALFGVSLFSEQITIATRVCLEFVNLCSSGRDFHATISLMREGRYSLYIGTIVKLKTLENLFQNLSACPGLLDSIRSVASTLAQGVRFFQLNHEMRAISGDISSVVHSLQGGPNPDIPTAGQVKWFCAFQAIKMASSVIELINVASIIRHGKSRYSDAIEHLTRALAAELRMMEELYR